ncbi:MAX gene-associated protein-like isoform X3 [Parambassis ranga]|uniref:MAX gene-associated protein-like isoform X3 n=1 Tax=Parambassis ranga TaxID=210632 RepID=A0A6P7H985_9TELE|nr:MAX gene-associated protein-like isoform X3 [Parambassis ranga]
MASKKKQRGMVTHQGGATVPDRPPAGIAVSRKGKASEGRMKQSTSVTSEEDKPNIYPTKVAIGRTGGLKQTPSSNAQSDNPSPDSICKGIRVTLDNTSMWNEFYRCRTEMILTKQGCRMFPYCRFRISGLQPSRKYFLLMDIQPVDNSHYKWTGKSWQVAGKAESHRKSRPFAHPESPAAGQHWMQSPVSFYRLKLTNNISDQEGNAVLHPMHRYLPRLHVVQTDKAAKDIKLNGPHVFTFTFPQTEFMAVTTYQNARFSQLKVHYNPFAKGLKEDGSSLLGLNLKGSSGRGRELNKDTTEQCPVKQSLKSLLANHKPKSLKSAEKPSAPEDPEKTVSANKDRSATMDPGESSRSTPPAQKLFSELIREAHVSLQRCNLEQLGLNHSSSVRTDQTNTKTVTFNGKVPDAVHKESLSVKTRRSGTGTKSKAKAGRHGLTPLNCKDNVQKDVVAAGSPNSSKDYQHSPDAPSEVKQHKQPVRLPLPALALFLKQHSSKFKKSKSKPGSSPPAPSAEPLAESHTSEGLPSDHTTSAPLKDPNAGPDTQASGPSRANLTPDEVFLNVTGQTDQTCPDAATDLLVPRPDDHMASVTESLSGEPAVPEGTAVLSQSDRPFFPFGTSTFTLFSKCSTSAASCSLSPPLSTVLPAPHSPQTPTKSSTLPSDSATLKSLLTDPDISSLSFEPPSPASSPEPLPALPASLTLELDSSRSEAASGAEHAEDLLHSKDSSVFKWHTVLPPAEPYIDTSYTPFQPTLQNLNLTSQPLLPSHTPPQPEPQSLNTPTSAHPPGPPPSFQDTEQSLPFPAELSPLALQLSLSPTFSSLDGDGLSPTPSIADLVHFFSTDDDLGMGVEFSNTDVAVALPPPATVEANEVSQQVQLIPASKACKRKKPRRRKMDVDQKMDDTTYRSMQPNLEEVEEQLFISFTSKEALKLHVTDSSEEPLPQPQAALEGQPDNSTPDNDQTNGNMIQPSAESVEETITAFQRILLKDLKLMKHRQVIHPVLQEVGLKMTLLDPTLAIDLQYLGVRLPIPTPGGCPGLVTEELPPQNVSAAFVSRTGKTTDVTQIKGWREKFSPSEAPPTTAACRPEAGPSSDLQKKNLSAFCSDMLDEYLENEGKVINERAASFSQPPVEPPVYELPTRSTSYVRTLDHILNKRTTTSLTSDLISGFVPPSKRLKETKTCRKADRKQKRHKQNKPGAEDAAALGSEPSQAKTKQAAADPTSAAAHIPTPTLNNRRKLKPRTISQTLSLSRSTALPKDLMQDLAPLESDSELVPDGVQHEGTCRSPVPQTLIRQRDLEDATVWEGQYRTRITEDRAVVALTSLFTLTGFVRENPTDPIQLVRRQPPRCLNEFCRLGCICSSLSHCLRSSHCGRTTCMFGCSCLKQKVVLLKNLDGSDSSPPSHHGNSRKRKRRRRMKMAYILKEADSVSQPAERIRTLWKRDSKDYDPELVYIPTASSKFRAKVRENHSSCARVRAYTGLRLHNKKVKPADRTPQKQRRKLLQGIKSKTSRAPTGEPVQTPPSDPAAEPTPKPSKRLVIRADCKWESDTDRNHALKRLCEAMAQDQLGQPFWIRKYLISPISQTVEGSGTDRCIQYKVRVSRPKTLQEKPAALEIQSEMDPAAQRIQTPQTGNTRLEGREAELPEYRQEERTKEAGPPEDKLEERTEEAGPPEDRREEPTEEAEPPEDWQREVEESDIDEAEDCVDNAGTERGGKTMVTTMALPFLTGISPAGFLSANRKQPGGTGDLIQVNGKLYPLAKIQLGKMGALHPANRLAAYLTGRVLSSRGKQASPSPCPLSSKPPQSSAPTTQAISSAFSAGLHATVASMTATAPPTLSSKDSVSPVTAVLGAHRTFPVVLSHPSCLPTSSSPMVLQPVQMATGVQYYRRSDGKLVQLIPISQLRSVNPHPPAGRGPSSPSVLSVVSTQAPPVSVIKRQTTPPTKATPSSTLILPQKTTCTFKILPPAPGKEPVIVTCTKAPTQPPVKVLTPPRSVTLTQPSPTAPVKAASVKLPTSLGAELGVKPVKVSPMLLGPGGALVQQKPQTIPPPPPHAVSEVTPAPNSNPTAELASDPVDLDIICVDDDTLQRDVVVLTSSSDTDNSSDVESDDDEEEQLLNNLRDNHNVKERLRRGKMRKRFDGLRQQLGLTNRMSKIHTLMKAQRTIQELRRMEVNLKKKKSRLRKKRDEYLSTLAPPAEDLSEEEPGGSSEELKVITGSTNVTSPHQILPYNEVEDEGQAVAAEMEEESSRLRRPEGTRIKINLNQVKETAGALLSEEHETVKAADDHILMTSSVSPQKAPPTPTPVQTNGVSKPVLNPPAVSYSAVRQKLRTIPNILSRRKNPAVPSVEGGQSSLVVPAEILSLVGGALPVQPVLTLSPLLAGQTVLQTSPMSGVASVTLNISSLTSTQIHLTGPVTAPNVNVLPPVQPENTQQHTKQTQSQPAAPPDPHWAPAAGSDRITDQDQPRTGQGARCMSEVKEVGPSRPEPRGDSENETLTSLLNEIVFLSQQTGVPPTTAASPSPIKPSSEAEPGGAEDQGHTQTPVVKQHYTDATETEGVGINCHSETTQTGVQGEHTSTSKEGVLAPPPLLQMKVGGAKRANPTGSDRAAVDGEEERSNEGVLPWRPMPRLVPLGLRGNPPS